MQSAKEEIWVETNSSPAKGQVVTSAKDWQAIGAGVVVVVVVTADGIMKLTRCVLKL